MDKERLQYQQEQMRARQIAKRPQAEMWEVADVTQEERARCEYKARTDLTCPYCRKNQTRESQRTRELLPCTKCRNLRITLSKYGLSLGQYFQMLREQDGKCAICNRKMNPPCIDHCHELEHCRGLLCRTCNSGIGFMKDDEDIMHRAMMYVTRNRLSRKWWFQSNPAELQQ